MFSIELKFITGFMLGVEFLTKERTGGVAAFIIDIGIIRIGFYHVDE